MCNLKKMGRLHSMGILVILVNFSTIITVSGVTLTAPNSYTAFTGDIRITYSNLNVSEPYLHVVEQLPGVPEKIIQNIPLSSRYPDGEFEIRCGSIDYAGKFVFKIVNGKTKETVTETTCVVRWPVFVLTIPQQIETSSADITLQFEVKNEIKCNSIHAETMYLFELVWHKEDPTETDIGEVIEKSKVAQFQNLVTHPIKFDCLIFDQPGMYQVVFKTSILTKPVASSNEMKVIWSPEYAISSDSEYIFPCTGDIKVYYQQPKCASREDKINLFKQVAVSNSPASEKKLEYMTQKRADIMGNSISFSCDTFNEFDNTSVGYCFNYKSHARNKAVHEQYSFCLPKVFSKAIAVDGGWSDWSQWSVCSQTCEGGAQTRYRKCDNPPSNEHGNFCSGETLEENKCGVKCAKVPTTLHPPKVYTPDPKCLCGCQIASDRGTIVSSETCVGSSRWIITVKKGHIIKLTFERYTLSAQNSKTEVYVRDGDSTSSDLIIKDDGHDPPRLVQTSQNKMWIEYLTPYDSDNVFASGEGFAATFTSFKNNQTGFGLNTGIESTIWGSTILVIGILLCVAIIVAVVLFCIYHRHNVKKQQKHLQQIQNQALLVNGEAHTSPSHSASASSIKGSTNISFGDPAGSSPTRKSGHKKRDYIVAKDNPHSPTRVRDVKSKHHGKRSQSPSKRKSGANEIKDSPHGGGLPSPANYSSPQSKHRQALGNTPTSVYSISSHGYMPVSTLGSPGHTPPIGTPGSTGSPHPPQRGEVRNKSFMTAVKKPSGPPIAGEEDLSPTSPVGVHPGYPITAHPVINPGQYGREQIPMDAYYNMNNGDNMYGNNGRIAETAMYSPHTKHRLLPHEVPEKRPPVEGRDSLTRKQKAADPTYETVQNASHRFPKSTSQSVTTPDRQNANYIMPTSQHKPEIKPLPLRSVQRPDGQSPDTNTSDDKNNANTPRSYVSSELSPIFQNTKLFPETLSKGPSEMDLDLPGENDFEYDDYMPELPGSYFNLDPHAYTLTWSQQPTWSGGNKTKQQQQQYTGSQHSLGPDNNGSMC